MLKRQRLCSSQRRFSPPRKCQQSLLLRLLPPRLLPQRLQLRPRLLQQHLRHRLRRHLPHLPHLPLPQSNWMVTNWEAPYTAGEEVANSVIHIIGSHLGAAMIALLVWQAIHSGTDLGWKITSGCIFGATVILLYAISGAYHAVTYKPAKDVLNILDHMAIYFLIAGTYTPFCLVTLRASGHATLAWSIFGVEWAAVIAGVLVKVWNTGKRHFISTFAYIAMGWVALIAALPLAHELHAMGFAWLVIGGLLYTSGCVFYLWRGLPYHHPIWHLFVLAGSLCHFFCILWHVMV